MGSVQSERANRDRNRGPRPPITYLGPCFKGEGRPLASPAFPLPHAQDTIIHFPGKGCEASFLEEAQPIGSLYSTLLVTASCHACQDPTKEALLNSH